MTTINRRYDIDWLRVIAIALLLMYHVAIGFQSWGIMIGFITNDKSWDALWIPMAALNIWRIPFLFFVSGMGVYFAMRQRNWIQLIKERSLRILLPYVFGAVCIFPISGIILRDYYHWETAWSIHPGHLWFLGNIFSYVLLLSPLFFFLKNNEQGKVASTIRKLFSSPSGLLIVAAAFIAESMIVKPNPYELYAMTWHGYFLGLLAFFFGFCFTLAGEGFSQLTSRWKWLWLLAALSLFATRYFLFGMKVPYYLLVLESHCWIYFVFGLGYQFLNRPGKTLAYLSEAAYPVYISHMIFLFLGAYLIFPVSLAVELKFVLGLVFTFAGCFLFYEFLIRRINVLRLLFGLKWRKRSTQSVTLSNTD